MGCAFISMFRTQLGTTSTGYLQIGNGANGTQTESKILCMRATEDRSFSQKAGNPIMHTTIRRLSLAALLFFCGTAFLAVAQKKATPRPDPDEAYLAAAKKEGYDLSKPYKLWFRLTSPPQCEKQVDVRLQQAGFEVELWPKGDVGTIVIARKTMVPDLAALQKIRQDFKSLGTSACDPRDPVYFVSWGFVTAHFDGIVMK